MKIWIDNYDIYKPLHFYGNIFYVQSSIKVVPADRIQSFDIVNAKFIYPLIVPNF